MTNSTLVDKIVEIVAYLAIFGFAIYSKHIDRYDWECPEWGCEDKECKPGLGMPVRNTKPDENDDICEILDKIDRASEAESKNVKWRMSIFKAVVSMFLVFFLLLTPGKLPKWNVFYMASIISFVIIFMHTNWYSYHRYKFAQDHTKENVKKLREHHECI